MPGDAATIPDQLPDIYADLINSAIAERPEDMVVTMHLCRGNFRSTFVAEGGYEPVAEMLFNGIGVDGYFMEYDTERAGGFEPLRFMPKGKTVVLGLVTSKTRHARVKDGAERRIDEAARSTSTSTSWASARSAASPRTEEGNLLTEDEQWAKLAPHRRRRPRRLARRLGRSSSRLARALLID